MRAPEPSDAQEQEFSVFVRRARQAAHQALYFLYEVEAVDELPDGDVMKLSQDTREDIRFARGQVRLILQGTYVPPGQIGASPGPAEMARGLPAFLSLSDGKPSELFALHDQLSAGAAADRQAARQGVVGFWEAEVSKPVAEPDWKVKPLVDQLRAFLRVTRPRGFDFVSHSVDRSWIMIRRNLTALVGALLSVLAFTCVEQLRSLLSNNSVGFLAVAIVALGGIFIELLRYSPLVALKALALLPGTVGRSVNAFLEKRTDWLKMATIKLRVGKRAFFQWAAYASQPERGIARWPETGMMRSLIGRWELIRAALLALYLFGAHQIVRRTVEEQSRATFDTVYPIAGLMAFSLVPLHWFDLWGFIDRRPIRLLGLLLFISFLVGALAFDHYLLFAVGTPAILLAVLIVYAIKRGGMNAAGIVMTASCAAVTSLAFVGKLTSEREVWQVASSDPRPFVRVAADRFPFGGETGPPVVLVAASGGGSRAAVYTALTLDALHNEGARSPIGEIGANIHAISSVSGGSLAAAAYIAEQLRRNERAADGEPDTTRWTVTSLARKNFILPTLQGALLPGLSRGKAIEDFWEREVHLRRRTLRDVANLWNDAKGESPPFPLPLFNACALDGHAVVVSPLEVGAYSLDTARSRADRLDEVKASYGLAGLDGLTWVVDRDAIYGLDEWNAEVNPTLAQSVRASANFPFGFPLVEVATPRGYGEPYQKGVKRILLTDGGVLSNSGLWSLFHLMTTRPHIQKALKQRGVLLLVIDASRMPEYNPKQTDIRSLFGAIRDQAPIAQNLHRKMFELLEQEFEARLEIVGIDLPPTVFDNVQTTWALDDRSLKRLECNFTALWTGTTYTEDEECRKIRGASPGNGHPVGANVRKRLAEAWARLKAPLEPPASAPGTMEEEGKKVAVAPIQRPKLLRIPLD